MADHKKLFIPGPTEVAPEVLAELSRPMIGHRFPELSELVAAIVPKVQEMLLQMSPPDREVLVLRYLEQLSTCETAAVLGLTVDGVKSRQRRALERFTNLLADHSVGNA